MGVFTFGYSKIEMGAIAVDGGMSTTLAEIGFTYKDTASMVESPATATPHKKEGTDRPILMTKEIGDTTVKFSIMDPDATLYGSLKGGTLSGTSPNVWASPSAGPSVEQSLKLTSEAGIVWAFPRVAVDAVFNQKLARSGINLLEVTCLVMAPTKLNTYAINATDPIVV